MEGECQFSPGIQIAVCNGSQIWGLFLAIRSSLWSAATCFRDLDRDGGKKMGHEVATNGGIIKKENIKGVTGGQCGSGRLIKSPPVDSLKHLHAHKTACINPALKNNPFWTFSISFLVDARYSKVSLLCMYTLVFLFRLNCVRSWEQWSRTYLQTNTKENSTHFNGICPLIWMWLTLSLKADPRIQTWQVPLRLLFWFLHKSVRFHLVWLNPSWGTIGCPATFILVQQIK